MFDKFSDRHIGVTNPEDLKAMLAVIGVKSVDELIAQVIPQSIRLKQPLALPQGMSEYEFANHIQALAAKNRTLRSFIGMGYYPCAVPAAITRNVFENPAWYTSYTPYQAEMSQGVLQSMPSAVQPVILPSSSVRVTVTSPPMPLAVPVKSPDTPPAVEADLLPQP